MSIELPISPSLVDAHRAAVDEVNCWRGRCVDHYARIEARMTDALAAVAAHPDGLDTRDPHMFGAKAKKLVELVSDGARFHANGKDLRTALEQAKTVLAARNSIIHATGNVLVGLHGEWAWLYRFQPSGTDKAPQDGSYDRESANVFQTAL